MTTYTYFCDCGEITDKDFPLGQSKPTIKCKCGKRAEKAITPPAFVLKGSGWTKAIEQTEEKAYTPQV